MKSFSIVHFTELNELPLGLGKIWDIINPKRIEGLYKLMGLQTIYPKKI
jgi:hypothetical protein